MEVLQILKALTISDYGWQNHPAVKMWRGYEGALVTYGLIMCQEWINRGYKDTVMGKLHCIYEILAEYFYPPWFGNQKFHNSHKSNLLRKLPSHYKQFGWNVKDDLPYFWPVK